MVDTEIGMMPIDKHLVRTTLKRKTLASQKKALSEIAKKIKRKEKVKLSSLIREYELELFEKQYPHTIPQEPDNSKEMPINRAFSQWRNSMSKRKHTKIMRKEIVEYAGTYLQRRQLSPRE
jgi:hypothetical protein